MYIGKSTTMKEWADCECILCYAAAKNYHAGVFAREVLISKIPSDI